MQGPRCVWSAGRTRSERRDRFFGHIVDGRKRETGASPLSNLPSQLQRCFQIPAVRRFPESRMRAGGPTKLCPPTPAGACGGGVGTGPKCRLATPTEWAGNDPAPRRGQWPASIRTGDAGFLTRERWRRPGSQEAPRRLPAARSWLGRGAPREASAPPQGPPPPPVRRGGSPLLSAAFPRRGLSGA